MKKLPRKQGQALVEYVLLVCLLAIICIAAMTGMGDAVANGFLTNISSTLNSANTSISGS